MNSPKPRPNVLLIDDQAIAAEVIGNMLSESQISLHYVADASVALAAALQWKPTVILLDLMMPRIDGFELTRQFRANPETAQIPIILLSIEERPEQKVRGFETGANDYLVKWPDKLELLARVNYHSSAYIAHKERDDAFRSLHQSQQELLQRTEQLADSQAALHQAQKIEALGKLTGGVAHDFNNVLQIIAGNLQLLKMDTQNNLEAQRRIVSALDGVARGAGLASHLLAFARRQPLQPVTVDVGCLIRDMDDLLKQALNGQTTSDIVIADNLWNTLVDPNQLENVILNLVINARDAMENAGKLTISTRNFVVEDHNATFPSAIAPGEYVLIAVSDIGCGMSADVMDRAFEPFFTTKPEGQGTGLGLSMAYGVVKQSGGHIEIDSKIGRGTTVNVYLPRVMAGAAVEVTAFVEPGPAGQGVETILVVEDEAEVRSATVEMLGKLGFRTLEAEDGLSGLRIIESNASIDLLFTDVMMPGPIRSTEMVEKARQIRPDMPVLFTSGYIEGGTVQGSILDRESNLLHKPYTFDELARRIRSMLKMPESVAE